MMSNGVRCPCCGTLLLGQECLEQILEKIADDNFSVAGLTVDCPRCHNKFGFVIACDQTGVVVLLVPPEKAERCFKELKQMLDEGLTVATIVTIVSNTKKPQCMFFVKDRYRRGTWRPPRSIG